MPHFVLPVVVLWALRLVVKACRVFIWGGKVTKITDGDTISVVRWFFFPLNGIRLDIIDAPEMSQEGGKQAKAKLEELLPIGTWVQLNIRKKDGYGRPVAVVYKNNVSINHKMIRSGHAWFYDKYSDDKRAAKAQLAAKRKRRGIWRGKNILSPEEFRKQRRKGR